MAIEGYLRQHRPAFFLNACQVGREGWALTRIGGWANRLVSCGVSLFVGPLWSVRDSSALTFANAFYSCLFAGETLAVATQQARHGCSTGWRPYLAGLQRVWPPERTYSGAEMT